MDDFIELLFFSFNYFRYQDLIIELVNGNVTELALPPTRNTSTDRLTIFDINNSEETT